MKKVISLLLCIVMMLPVFAAGASAMSLSAGTVKLNSQFKDGALAGKLDYVYYSPVKGADDSTKYPVLVWVHGMKSGLYKRSQLNNYEFSNWASEEYQSRFVSTGGCYLLAVRASTSPDNSWSAEMCPDLYATVQDFIALNNKNIDTNRLYIAGYSTGGTMVWDMLDRYPDMFAAAFPLASIFQPKLSTLKKLSGVSVWMFSSDNDYYQLSETEDVMPNFDFLSELKKDKENVRLTSFTQAVYADGTKKMNGNMVAEEAEHYIWESFTYDMHMADGVTPYLYSTTRDGYGNKISFDDGTGIITWLDGQTREKSNSQSGNSVSFFTRLKLWFQSYISLFRNLIMRIVG